MRSAGLAHLPLVLAGISSCALYAIGFDFAPEAPATEVYFLLAAPLFALYLFAAWRVWRRPEGALGIVLVGAVLFRGFAFAEPPRLSSDVYRYAWDGRVQRAGLSPYAHAPSDVALAPLRDTSIHPNINRPAARTVYPPGAQAVFRWLPYSIDAVRGAMIGADLLSIGLLVLLLRRRGMPAARVVLYAWAPLVVFEVANGGHLEAVVVPLLVSAALVFGSSRGLAGALLGAAAAVKLFPGLAAAAFLRPRARAVLAPAAAVFALGYAAYASAGAELLGFLPSYVGVAEDHNIGLRRLLEWALSPIVERPRTPAFVLCVLALGAGAVWIARREAPLERTLLALFGLYLVVLPTAFHPWYAVVLVPWLCFHPRASWLWLTGALPLSYLKYSTPGELMPAWVVPLEWGPTAFLLAWEARRR